VIAQKNATRFGEDFTEFTFGI
jgi:UDPglucose 6-dehydrogenase